MENGIAEVAEEYKSALRDLTENKKPVITSLTMVAGENLDAAPVIASAILERIHTVEPDIKLTTLYLLDSIVKNIGGVYKELFAPSLRSAFLDTFVVSKEALRHSLIKLLNTWTPDHFPEEVLRDIHAQIKLIPPTTAQGRGPAVHVNPRFVGQQDPRTFVAVQRVVTGAAPAEVLPAVASIAPGRDPRARAPPAAAAPSLPAVQGPSPEDRVGQIIDEQQRQLETLRAQAAQAQEAALARARVRTPSPTRRIDRPLSREREQSDRRPMSRDRDQGGRYADSRVYPDHAYSDRRSGSRDRDYDGRGPPRRPDGYAGRDYERERDGIGRRPRSTMWDLPPGSGPVPGHPLSPRSHQRPDSVSGPFSQPAPGGSFDGGPSTTPINLSSLLPGGVPQDLMTIAAALATASGPQLELLQLQLEIQQQTVKIIGNLEDYVSRPNLPQQEQAAALEQLHKVRELQLKMSSMNETAPQALPTVIDILRGVRDMLADSPYMQRAPIIDTSAPAAGLLHPAPIQTHPHPVFLAGGPQHEPVVETHRPSSPQRPVASPRSPPSSSVGPPSPTTIQPADQDVPSTRADGSESVLAPSSEQQQTSAAVPMSPHDAPVAPGQAPDFAHDRSEPSSSSDDMFAPQTSSADGRALSNGFPPSSGSVDPRTRLSDPRRLAGPSPAPVVSADSSSAALLGPTGLPAVGSSFGAALPQSQILQHPDQLQQMLMQQPMQQSQPYAMQPQQFFSMPTAGAPVLAPQMSLYQGFQTPPLYGVGPAVQQQPAPASAEFGKPIDVKQMLAGLAALGILKPGPGQATAAPQQAFAAAAPSYDQHRMPDQHDRQQQRPHYDEPRRFDERRFEEPRRSSREKPPKEYNPLSSKVLKLRNEEAINALYSSLAFQCANCGQRFGTSELLNAHLDWHFKQNERKKDRAKKATSRSWYPKREDWAAGAEVVEVLAQPFFGEQPQEAPKEVHSVVADENQPTCPHCSEKFEQFWDDDQEQWMFRDAVRLPDGGPIVHAACRSSQGDEPSEKRQRLDEDETPAAASPAVAMDASDTSPSLAPEPEPAVAPPSPKPEPAESSEPRLVAELSEDGREAKGDVKTDLLPMVGADLPELEQYENGAVAGGGADRGVKRAREEITSQ